MNHQLHPKNRQPQPPRPQRRVSFSECSTLCVVEDQTKGLESQLWYSKRDTDLDKRRLSYHIQRVRCAFEDATNNDNDGGKDGRDEKDGKDGRDEPLLQASDIIGLDRYLTPDITEEYRLRRKSRTEAVLREQRTIRRRHSMCDMPGHSASLSSMSSMPSVPSMCSGCSEDQASQSTIADQAAIAKVARRHSKWARRRARAIALFLEKDEGHQSMNEGDASMEGMEMGHPLSNVPNGRRGRRHSTCL